MKPKPLETFSSFLAMTQKLAKDGSQMELNTGEVQKKLLSFFQVGDYYYYVYNLKTGDFDFVSPEIRQVLGHECAEITTSLLLGSIHPEDIPWFLNFENAVTDFFSQLRPDQILKYKVRYDYRIKKTNGEYIRILQQVIALHYDTTSHGLMRTFGVHTDITHLKKDGNPVLSFIGLEGEPSYIDVDVKKIFIAARSVISDREKQVLRLLIEGKSSKIIANRLGISQETVKKHRSNMLRKTECFTTAELIARSVRDGWV